VQALLTNVRGKGVKIEWRGDLKGVQPRIRLTRSFDERYHTYLGYVLHVTGVVGDSSTEFSVAIGKGAHSKHAFRVGDTVSGVSEPVADPRLETAQFYKTSKLRIVKRGPEIDDASPPWLGIPPCLETYRSRGHRRLAIRTYDDKCRYCIWGCRMPVEMIIDQWNPSNRRFRFETFCYGPKSCSSYRAGPTRKVPGRKWMNWKEEDWVDEDATAHRGLDE
jgi:hypothetical protein